MFDAGRIRIGYVLRSASMLINGRKEGGRNTTEHMGASPMMPVNRDMQSDRRVKSMYWKSMTARGGRRATSRS